MSNMAKSGGFFKEFFNSIGAIFIGLLMILLCMFGLARNEFMSAKMIRALNEVSKTFTQIESSVDSSNNSRLVAARGQLSFTPVTDRDYPIKNESFVIDRRVEVVQWRETKSNTEGEPPTYNLVWTTTPISSANYPSDKQNPPWPTAARLKSNTTYSNDVRMGEFNLAQNYFRWFPKENNLKINIPDPENFFPTITTIGGIDYYTNVPDASTPVEAGQIRMSFYTSNVSRASVLAQQNGENFGPYRTRNKTVIDRAFPAFLSGDEMIQRLHTENTVKTWVLRILFCVLVCVGFTMLFSPIKLLVRYIPFLGKWLGKATQVIARVIGCTLGIIISLLVICISWVMVRPLVVIPLMVVLVGIIYLMTKKRFVGDETTDTIPVNPAQPAFATDNASVSVSAANAKFCPNCGASLDDNSAFCPQCGNKR